MANGPDNFRAAQELVDDARRVWDQEGDIDQVAKLLGEAQVRATLALAAAVAHAHIGQRAAGDWNQAVAS